MTVAIRGLPLVRAAPATSPCAACPKRAACRAPCPALESLIQEGDGPAPRERPSLLLTEGRAPYAHTRPANDDDAAPGPWPQIVAAYRPRLRSLLRKLPDKQRHVIGQWLAGRSRADMAADLRLSTGAVDRALHAALDSLKTDLGSLPLRRAFDALTVGNGAPDFDGEKEEPTMEQIAHGEPKTEGHVAPTTEPQMGVEATPPAANGPHVGSARCAERGCRDAVSRRPASRPELAPYCTLHRQVHARRARHQERAHTGADDRAATQPDRALALRLLQAAPGRSGRMEVAVTPALALAFLERNVRNRPIAENRVALYARDIEAGAWVSNNQGLAFGADGELYDGQHRLWAVVRAGRPATMLVVTGLPPEARATIDQGRSRSVGDALRIFDGEVHGRRIVAWLRALQELEDGRLTSISHAEAKRQLERHRADVAWFLERGPRARPYYRAPVAAALIYAHRVAAPAVEAFTRGYVDGADLPAGSPVLALRSYVAERLRAGGHERVASLRALACVLAFQRGERVERPGAGEAPLEHFRSLHRALDADVTRGGSQPLR